MNFEQALNAPQEKAYGKVYVLADEKNVFSAKIQMQQTPEYLKQLRSSSLGKECLEDMKHTKNSPKTYQMPTCLEATYLAQLYDSIKIVGDIPEDVKPSAEVRNITKNVWGLVNHMGYWSMTENPNELTKEKHFEIQLDISHEEEYMNATIQTPFIAQYFKRSPIPDQLRPLLEQIPHWNVAERVHRESHEFNDVCVVDHNQVFTFDNREVEEIEIGKCWQAVVQSRPVQLKNKNQVNRQDDVSVLLRELATDRRELLVVVAQSAGQDHNIQITPTGQTYTVLVNGKEEKISQTASIDVFDDNHQPQDGPAVRVYLVSPLEVKVTIRNGEMNVFYDGKVVKVQSHGIYRNNVVGICGTYNGEKINDVSGPQGGLLREKQLLPAAWTVSVEKCNDQTTKQQALKARKQETSAPSSYGAAKYIQIYHLPAVLLIQ